MKHDQVIQYLEELIRKEYRPLIEKDKAIVKRNLEYDIYLGNEKTHGEADLFFLDFEARSGYFMEIKHDRKKNCEQKAQIQLYKDFRMADSFYRWAIKNGYMVWYSPKLDGKIVLVEKDDELLENYFYTKKDLIARIIEYNMFFKEILKGR